MEDFKLQSFSGFNKGTKEYNDVMAQRARVRRRATDCVMDYLESRIDDLPEDVKNAVKALEKQVGGGGRISEADINMEKVGSLFNRKGEKIKETDIMLETKLGRKEIVKAIKRLAIEKGKIIKLNEKKEIYILE